MPEAQIYQDIWIRWVHTPWQNEGDWRPDISPNVLHNKALTKAQFIFDDFSCIFIPLEELRKVLAGKERNKNGMIIFNVNPRRRTVEGVPVNLAVIESRTKRRKENADLFKGFSLEEPVANLK